ncbi:hypothetical protein AYO41_02545 [Verrucomicrobia bacterium SCGC AG-212-E04]|nr:hypothetical protein AYO41_02545 [Verrucomicrobia bacterium SCGC AG-212-E04]
MNTTAVQSVMSDAHQCAMAMLDSGTYIERELPNVHMDDASRTSATELCSHLIGTKHDIIHELSELDDLLKNGGTDERILSAVALIIQWLSDDVSRIDQLVTCLDAAGNRDPRCGSAYILVAESAVNILIPYKRAKVAADLLTNTNAAGNA